MQHSEPTPSVIEPGIWLSLTSLELSGSEEGIGCSTHANRPHRANTPHIISFFMTQFLFGNPL
jgi:hypothetical protein